MAKLCKVEEMVVVCLMFSAVSNAPRSERSVRGKRWASQIRGLTADRIKTRQQPSLTSFSFFISAATMTGTSTTHYRPSRVEKYQKCKKNGLSKLLNARVMTLIAYPSVSQLLNGLLFYHRQLSLDFMLVCLLKQRMQSRTQRLNRRFLNFSDHVSLRTRLKPHYITVHTSNATNEPCFTGMQLT